MIGALPWAHISVLLVLGLLALGVLELGARVVFGTVLAGLMLLLSAILPVKVSWNAPFLVAGCITVLIVAPELLARLVRLPRMYAVLAIGVGGPTYLVSAFLLNSPGWLAIADAVIVTHLGFSAAVSWFVAGRRPLDGFDDLGNSLGSSSYHRRSAAYRSDAPSASASSPISSS